jgi:hypothetical protein
MWRFIFCAVLLGVAATGLWLWFDDGGRETGAVTPAAVVQRGHPTSGSMGSSHPPAVPGLLKPPAREAPSSADTATATPAASPASDSQPHDPFRAAFEESEKRRAAARKSTFGDAEQ